jgi:hypothetical protein
VTGWWGRMNNRELRNLYSSSNIIRVIKSRKMRWLSRNTMGGIKSAQNFSQGRGLCVDVSIIEERTLGE